MSDSALTDRLPTRHVIFSKTLGVYLGTGTWSFRNPGKLETAPTFGDAEIGQKLAEVAKAENSGTVEPHLVWPSKENFLASVEDCANAGLPRWGRTAIPVTKPDLGGES